MTELSDERYPPNTRALLARQRAVQAEAERIMGETRQASVRVGFPKPGMSIAPPVERGDARLATGDLVPASCVELDEAVGDDSLLLIGRDPITGRVRLKIWMLKEDASPEWGLWVRRWLTRKSRQALRLLR